MMTCFVVIAVLIFSSLLSVQAFFPSASHPLRRFSLSHLKSPTLSFLAMTSKGSLSGAARLMKSFEVATQVQPDGFPHFAEALRRAGFEKNNWSLPSCTSFYQTSFGDFVQSLPPLVPEGVSPVAAFNRDAIIKAIRDDQVGKTTFPEFLQSIWKGGVVKYDVDFAKRTVIYYGIRESDFYEEEYPKIDLIQNVEDLLLE